MALIGAGRMAPEHIRAFTDVPGVEVVGIHSRSRDRAERVAEDLGIAPVCDSIRELYERTWADLVVVAVSETNATAVALACFELPWTVLLEKPAGLDVHEAGQLRDAERSSGRRVRVALNRRLLSSTRAVLSGLERCPGARFITVQDQEDQKEATAIGHPPAVVKNWMYANAVHMVDFLRVFGRGRVTKVERVRPWNPAAPGVVVAAVEFDSGDAGLYEAVWNGPGPWAVSVGTAEKRWELRPVERAKVQRAGERTLEELPTHPRDRAFKPGFRLQAELAVAEALGNRTVLPTLDESLETMRLIQAIYAPGKAGSR